jgi:hypothetical protein
MWNKYLLVSILSLEVFLCGAYFIMHNLYVCNVEQFFSQQNLWQYSMYYLYYWLGLSLADQNI